MNQNNNRLQSIDALRGFDMFFIMGGSSVLVAIFSLFPGAFSDAFIAQMDHVEWNGFACYDMIFPLFLFIAGISFPFSLSKNRDKGLSERKIYTQVVRRALILVGLGLLYNGCLSLDFAGMRFPSVLARIGIAWAFAAILFMNFKTKYRLIIAPAILLGYWVLLALWPAPDFPGAGAFTMEGNLVGFIDRNIMSGHLYKDIFDPEGVLSTLPAIVTAMLGMFAGEIVSSTKDGYTGNKKAITLALIGASLVVVGSVWSLVFPINKALWSSSFVCFVGGLSYLLFALFYFIIDVKQLRNWTLFFTVIGMNSITIYMAQRIINFGYTARFFSGGLANLVPEAFQPLVTSSFFFAVSWLFLYILYSKKIFLKV